MAALRQLGVTSAAELLDVREGDVRALRNAGGKTWREIAEAQSRVLREMAVARLEMDGARPSSGSAEPIAPAEPGLRDWFAGRVISGLYAGRGGPVQTSLIEVDAQLAYEIADAMLAARAKGGA
jgi:hypothetical protein